MLSLNVNYLLLLALAVISCSPHLWKILLSISWNQKQWNCCPIPTLSLGGEGGFDEPGMMGGGCDHSFTAVLPDFRFWSQAAPQGCQQGVFCLHLLNLHYFLVTTVIKLWSLSSRYNYKWHDTCYGMPSICRGKKKRDFLRWPDRLKSVRYFFLSLQLQ